MKITSQKILITGGATGIGLGLTQRFVTDNNKVIICGRREQVLKKVSQQLPGVIPRVCDLSVEAERIELLEWIRQEHSDVSVLVNNAGIQNWMDVADAGFYEKTAEEITTNIIAPLHLASLFAALPSITTIMNVTSGLAFVPLAKVAVYSATKAFMRSFTLSLRYMLRAKNIEVIEIIPPALDTDLGGTGIHNGQPAVSDFIESIFKQLEAGKNELTFGTSEGRLEANNNAITDYFKRMNP